MNVAASGYLLRIVLVATLGGLLFGYDTAVISGAIVFLTDEFALTPLQEGWAVSCALVGCIVGVAAAGYLSDAFGRRRSLLISAVLFLVSAIGSALPQDLTQFVIARVLGGMGIGVASMLSPVYIAELSPPKLRGRLVALNQLAIITGMLVTYGVNYALVDVPDNWRYMLGSEALPAATFLVLLFFIPETPRWLFLRGRQREAAAVLDRIGGPAYTAEVLAEVERSRELPTVRIRDLWDGPLRRALVVGIALAIFQQITGINTILYYTPKIFLEAGWATTEGAFVSTLAVGAVNLIFTIVSLRYIDRWGRRPLLAFSVGGMAVFLFLLSAAFYVGTFPPLVTVVAVLGYVAFFVVGLGPGYWVLISEIYPNAIRGRAVSIATTVLWMAAFAISSTFPLMLAELGPPATFALYGVFSVLAFIFILWQVPETRNKTLEEIRMIWAR